MVRRAALPAGNPRFKLSRATEESKEAHFWSGAPWSQLVYEMAPEDYLGLVPVGDFIKEMVQDELRTGFHRSVRLCNRINRGERLDPPRLLLTDDDCGILAHEGRHRAAVAALCGLKKIPVVLTCMEKKGKNSPSARPRFLPTRAERCMACLRKGVKKFKPQDEYEEETGWGTQDLIYYFHQPPSSRI